MNMIHARQGFGTASTLIAPFHQLAHDHIGIVVTFLRILHKLAGTIQQTGDARHTVSPKQGKFEGARRIEGKFVTNVQMHNALMILLRIELHNFLQTLPGHFKRLVRQTWRPGPRNPTGIE